MAEVVKGMMASKDLLKLIIANRSAFTSFGKKNSHILRKKLTDLMVAEELSMDAQFMLYFFCSLMKNKTRVLQAITKLPEEFTGSVWFTELEEFIKDHMVQFPNEETEDKFAMIHLPATNPPLTLFCYLLSLPDEDKTYDNLISQQTFAQIDLSLEVQEENKEKMEDFWNTQITKTSNKSNEKAFAKKLEKGDMFDEAIYANQEADKYILLGVDFKDFPMKDEELGYSKGDIESYIASFLPKGKGKAKGG